MRVLIVGGGASGLVAAIYAANSGNEVMLVDKNNNLGKKILLTGNGKCNYWNKDISLKHYNSSNLDILDSMKLIEIIDSSNVNRKEELKEVLWELSYQK